MLLLAVDTSGKNGSLALARVTARESKVDVLEIVPLAGGAFSAELIPQIAESLSRHGYRNSDLEVFAVASGPGSFTGLRVGLAAIKALADALQKPIAAVSLLEAVASLGQTRNQVMAALDAGRGDIYLGEYELATHPRMLSERLLTREESVEVANGKTVATPDAALAEFFRSAGIECEKVSSPDSATIANLGWQHILRGDTVGPDELEANYIRRTDAEIFAQPKR